MDTSKLHIAIVSSPGLGHLIPMLLLGHRLATHHHAHVTVLTVRTYLSPAESQILRPYSDKKLVDIVDIPHDDISGLVDSNTKVVTQLCILMRETRQRIKSAIADMCRRPDALIGDLFCSELLPIAEELGIPNKYLFVTSTAWFVALTCYCHVLDKEIEGQYVDQIEPLKISGCKAVRPEDVVDPMLDRNDQQYREYLRLGKEYSLFDGILMNTWEDLEHRTLKALRTDDSLLSVVKVPVYPIGPLTTPANSVGSKSELIEWLDLQPSVSVIYVSFGSGGTMSAEQINELAWGLENSQQRFIWVVRPPMESQTDGSFFTAGKGPDGTPGYLPEGFLIRTHNVGKVVPLWAPQREILRHPSLGGFLSHCGWNSALESITNGVPMVAWPLYAEQGLNATLLTEELGVALRPENLPTKKVVQRAEIERMVRSVVQYNEGKVMREKAKELKYSGERALSEGGSSYNSLCEVVKECKKRL